MLLCHVHLLVLTEKVVRPGSTAPTVLKIIHWQSQYLAVDGMRVELSCRATDVSHEIVWLKDNRLVEGVVDQNGTLTIDDVAREDDGSYVCVVWNSEHIDYKRAIVYIGEDLTLYHP